MHRVGRVARAGRTGVTYSFVSQQELPYLFDLALFLGLNLPDPNQGPFSIHSYYYYFFFEMFCVILFLNLDLILLVTEFKPSDMRFGNIPRMLFESYLDQVNALIQKDDDSCRLQKVIN